MHYWRGVITHTTIVLAQPAYLAIRHLLGHAPVESRSPLNLTFHVLGWLYIVTRITIPFFTSPLRLLPSPKNEKFLLCHLDFNGGRPPTELFDKLLNETPNDGLVACWLPLYLRCEILATRPETLMEVMNHHNYDWVKPPLQTRVLASILGEGLVNVEGAKHKAMRRVVAPAFSGRQIRDLVPLFYSKGIALTKVMARQVTDTTDKILELEALFSRASLDVISSAGVGMDFNTLEDEDSPLAKLYYSVFRPPKFFMLLNLVFPMWLLRRLKGTAIAKTFDAQARLRQEVAALLQEKKEQMKDDESAQDSKDIIAGIMKSGDFSDEYLVGQLLTFLAAGHDTISSAVVFASLLLSRHPEWQARLRAECTAQLSKVPISEINASTFDPEKMPLMAAICNETLRLYPPAPGTVRKAAVPTRIGNVPIPQGTEVTIPIWAINRTKALWGEDAAEFKPERWLEGPHAANGGADSQYAFVTFLHGPRSCIGQGFARLEMKCLLAALFTRFSFEVAEPDKKIEIGGFITVKPEGGMRLRVHELQEKED